ncbi:MAG TPA: Tn3 family transposase [Steroidobacteraceae bacterium]
MSIDLGAHRTTTRLLYPKLAQRLTAADLHRIFGPTYKERQWAPTVARSPSSQVALLVQLRIFQAVGRFLPMKDAPASGIEHVAQKLGVECETRVVYAHATLYRHQAAVLEYLGVTSWGDQARELAISTMTKVAKARTDPADLINAAVDALVRHRFELPALIALRRLAGTAHSVVNGAQWREVCAHLTAKQSCALEALLKVESQTQESQFAQLCRAPGRASRKNRKALIERHQWLQKLPDPTAALRALADSKVLQWANAAKRLKAPELRRYVKPRRHALLLAVIRQARGQVLDDLTQMLLKLVGKVESKSADRLQEWYVTRHHQTDSLIRAFHESLILHESADEPVRKVAGLEELFTAHGGREKLKESCAQHLRHEKRNWRPFALPAFERLRSTLLRVAGILPLQATATTGDHLVLDHPSDTQAFNRRQLEVVAMLELAAAIKAGETFVTGSLSYDRFWDRLPREAADPAAIAAYAASQGWGEGADGFIRTLQESLGRQEGFIERALSDGKEGYMRCGKDGRPIVTAIQALPIPASVIELEKQLKAHMPDRQLLEAITNSEHWTEWSRHFGPPSRLSSQIKEATRRYVFAAFAYGCGLGPTEAARHLSGTVTADQLAFVDRRHIDIADLRAASADLINLYLQFELVGQWGTGETAVADGTHFEIYEDNLLAEHHIRYGKTGGIAYRHIADNYIALFSRFIACGTYEATYILDALLENLSDLHPKRVHADTHGQSAAVFGLAYLLGIELMPRIRHWRKLNLYRSERSQYYSRRDPLFSGTVNWSLIREHYDLSMQLSIAIQSGALAPSAVLARINSYSTRNRFALALQELGKAVRTTFLLDWIMNDSMRRAVHKCTTKIERHHKFAKHLAFGEHGLLRSNDPSDQEKAIVYNELVANAVVLQNVVDQTQALHALKSEGTRFSNADLAHLSPYVTSNLKRFGNFPTDLIPDPVPVERGLPS